MNKNGRLFVHTANVEGNYSRIPIFCLLGQTKKCKFGSLLAAAKRRHIKYRKKNQKPSYLNRRCYIVTTYSPGCENTSTKKKECKDPGMWKTIGCKTASRKKPDCKTPGCKNPCRKITKRYTPGCKILRRRTPDCKTPGCKTPTQTTHKSKTPGCKMPCCKTSAYKTPG